MADRTRWAVALLVVSSLLGGCGVDETGFDDLSRRADLIAGTSTTPTPAPTPTPPSELPEEWHVDTNNDRIPDFIEERIGLEVVDDRCIAALECGGVNDEVVLQEFATLLVLDASGSMADQVEDGQKMELAKAALEEYAVGIPATTDLGLMAYGHVGSMDPADRDVSCSEAELLAPLGEVAHDSLPAVLEEFAPTGFTPLGLALEEARAAFEGREGGGNRLVVVSDGRETCDGDPVTAAAALQEIGVVVDVVAFDVPDEEVAALEEIAAAGGGALVTADDGAELREALVSDLASFYETASAQACVVTRSVAAKGCLAAEQTRVTLAFEELRREGPSEDEEWDEDQLAQIRALERDAEAWNVEQQQLVEGANLPRIEQLREALDDARSRMEEVYGDEMDLSALAWPCAAGRGALIAADASGDGRRG